MIINKDILEKLNIGTELLDNYLIYYADFNGSINEFLDLDKITYDDKIWVASHFLNKKQLVHFALLCAESVLYIFENVYPKDQRPRKCIEYLKSISNYENIIEFEKQSFFTAAHSAYIYANNEASAFSSSDSDEQADIIENAAYAAASITNAISAIDNINASIDASEAAIDANISKKEEQEATNLKFLKQIAKRSSNV